MMTVDSARSGAAATTGPGSRMRAVMRQHASGVAVITTSVPTPSGPVLSGFCATSLTSLSLHPPMVSFAVTSTSASGRAWAGATSGIVHLLGDDQTHVAELFARAGPDKFSGAVPWAPGPQGHPLITGVLGWLLVSPRTRLELADHLLVVCDVRGCDVTSGRPLVHHDGGFHALPQ